MIYSLIKHLQLQKPPLMFSKLLYSNLKLIGFTCVVQQCLHIQERQLNFRYSSRKPADNWMILKIPLNASFTKIKTFNTSFSSGANSWLGSHSPYTCLEFLHILIPSHRPPITKISNSKKYLNSPSVQLQTHTHTHSN